MSAAEILEQIRRLPEDELRKLIECIEDEFVHFGRISEHEVETIDRRLQEHRDNPQDVVSWEEVKTDLDSKFKK